MPITHCTVLLICIIKCNTYPTKRIPFGAEVIEIHQNLSCLVLVVLEQQAQEQSSPKKGNTSQGNLCKDYICKCRREGRTLQQQDVG